MNFSELYNLAKDNVHGITRHPSGFFKPSVVRGYFEKTESGLFQQQFFDELLEQGFYRTYWQLVFPEQTAGLIKKVKEAVDGTDQLHVRFYRDGIIECEREIAKWRKDHWSGPRRVANEFLEEILEMNSTIDARAKKIIGDMFGEKKYHLDFTRKQL